MGLAFWAAVYLPWLGKEEMSNMEGGRALPAVAMLEGENWIVPKKMGENFYNKPPGINWLIAASFSITGQRSELAARLPSAVMILAFVSLLVLTKSPWLSLSGRVLAAVIFLTSMDIINTGRKAEIEAPTSP